MSIQSNINQAINIGTALYTQTPGYQAKVEEAKFKREGELAVQRGQRAQALAEQRGQSELAEQIEDSTNRIAIEHGLKRGAYHVYTPSQEDLLNDMRFEANQQAEDRKKIKNEQMNDVSERMSLLNMPTSLGGIVRDLKLNNEQLDAIERQLKENK